MEARMDQWFFRISGLFHLLMNGGFIGVITLLIHGYIRVITYLLINGGFIGVI